MSNLNIKTIFSIRNAVTCSSYVLIANIYHCCYKLSIRSIPSSPDIKSTVSLPQKDYVNTKVFLRSLWPLPMQRSKCKRFLHFKRLGDISDGRRCAQRWCLIFIFTLIIKQVYNTIRQQMFVRWHKCSIFLTHNFTGDPSLWIFREKCFPIVFPKK